jgi:hypothetical protein
MGCMALMMGNARDQQRLRLGVALCASLLPFF